MVVVVFFTLLTDGASTIPSNNIVVANPLHGHKEVPRSTGHNLLTTRYSDQQGSKSRQNVCDSTSNGTDQYQNGSSNLLTPYREQPRSTRIVVAYPRTAFSATKRTNSISFDQRVQVSQGHTSYKSKENMSMGIYVYLRDRTNVAASPARGRQSNREHVCSPCPHPCLRTWSRETGSAVPSRGSPLTFSPLRLRICAYSRDPSRFPRRRRPYHIPSNVIGSTPG